MTSQFEQAVRAALNLPLGSTELITPCAIVNLLGDLWLEQGAGLCRRHDGGGSAGASLRKADAARGTQDGAFVQRGRTAEEALERVLEAKRRL